MRTKTTRPRGIRVPTKMPKIEFNMEAIEAIKKRKKGVYERYLKQSKPKGR